MKSRIKSLISVLSCLFTLIPLVASAAVPDHWVGTWASAPMAVRNQDTQYGAADMTLREIAHVSLGGPVVRIILSNEFGLAPLTIGAANIALSVGHDGIDLSSSKVLTFSGSASVTVPPGALIVSDAADLKLSPFATVAVSLFLPAQPIQQLTQHSFADQTSYIAEGNVIGAQSMPSPTSIYEWPFLKGIEILAKANTASVVTIGDSITDGDHSTRDAGARWPDVLARRLQADRKIAKLSVLNEGIRGNRILHDGNGANALSRFDRDVLAQAGVKYLIILEGINDIGSATSPVNPSDPVTAGDVIGGLSQLAIRAHAHGIKVFGATLPPYVGAGYQSPKGESIRQVVNNWIRTTDKFDGVIDFDKATADPTHPGTLLPSYDSGDHLHPNDAGYKSMGESIDLKLFTK